MTSITNHSSNLFNTENIIEDENKDNRKKTDLSLDIKIENSEDNKEEFKESISVMDLNVKKLGLYNIMHFGGVASSYYVPSSTYLETDREYHAGYGNVEVTKLKYQEGHTKNLYNPDKKGPLIDLYSGCPFEKDGDVPAVIYNSNWITLSKKNYFSWGLDSLLLRCFNQYVKCVCYPLCIFVECGLQSCFDTCDCGTGFNNCLSDCSNGIESEKNPFCVVPLSEYIKQSEQ
jgi:hypothetical protein